jgi:hypothetical protein
MLSSMAVRVQGVASGGAARPQREQLHCADLIGAPCHRGRDVLGVVLAVAWVNAIAEGVAGQGCGVLVVA